MEVLVGGSGRGDGGEYGGRCVHRKRYLRVRDAFAVGTAIPVAVVLEVSAVVLASTTTAAFA